MCLFFCVCIQKVGQPRVCKVGKSLFSNLILTCFTYFLCASKMFNPFAALGRLTDQNIDKHLSIYSKSGIDLIIMERQP